MPSAETSIALANADSLSNGRVLVAAFREPDLARALSACTSVTVFAHDAVAARAHAGLDLRFDPWLMDGGPFDTVVLALPKETERLRMHLAMVRGVMARGARLALVGHNNAGIKSASRHVDELVGPAAIMDYRYHCRIVEAVAAPSTEAPFDPRAWRAEHAVEVGEWKARVVSYPGVFAHGRLDDGTRLLLEAFDDVDLSGPALDVCCGNGVIAARLAARGIEVTASDSDALAVQAASETLEDRARVVASDLFDDVGGPFKLIVTNPPFHAGVRTTAATAERLITDAPARLTRGGEIWLVGNRFLDYGDQMQAAFGNVHVAAENRRFRVWRARR